MTVIQTNNLTKSYGKSRGIVDLSLSVEQGEFFGFIGPNGAGKSTTIRTLLGLIRADSGSAQIFGKDIHARNTEILADIGYLPSEVSFYPGMRVKELLKLTSDLKAKDCMPAAKALCERFELDMNRKLDALSFGNRKKVGIVCALMHDPKLLILDEPTSGLDPLMQQEFFALLREKNEQGTTIFLSSHILSEIQRNCTRAAIIREGSIIACDTVETLAKTNAKRVTVQGTVDLTGLPGVKDCKVTPQGSSFLYGGDIRLLLEVLAKAEVSDLSIAEPDLQEVFLHYYQAKEEQP